MDDIIRISTNTPWEPMFGYSRAVKAGNLIVVSGTTGTDENGAIIGINQMYSQTRQAIVNIASALARAGGSLNDVIRTRIYVTDMSRFQEVARAHREAFAAAPPAATLVEVRRLVHPDMMVEIEVDAMIRGAVAPASTAAVKPAARARPRAAVKTKTKPGASGGKSKPARRK